MPKVNNQKYYIFDSTGVIEKHSNLYFHPNGITDVEDWLDAFIDATGVETTDNPYYDKEISTWSPQDRKLVIKGSVDDFRDYITEAMILNYLIVKRTVYETVINENEEEEQVEVSHSYVGFFIDSVSQRGQGSVELILSPDHFTNTFIFNVLASGKADPYNAVIKRAYVDRQHYDRVQVSNHWIPLQSFDGNFENDYYYRLFGGDYKTGVFTLSISNQYNLIHLYVKRRDTVYVDIDCNEISVITTSVGSTITYTVYGETSQSIAVSIGRPVVYIKLMTTHFTTTHIGDGYLNVVAKKYKSLGDIYSPVNMELFATNKEQFDFKYQYKDFRKPLLFNYDSLSFFTDEELSIIDSTNTFSDLSSTLRIKIIRACMYWYYIQCKEDITVPYRFEHNSSHGTIEYSVGKSSKRGIAGYGVPYIVMPTFIIPDFLSKYESSLKQISYDIEINVSGVANYIAISGQSITNGASFYNNNVVSKILSIYSPYINQVYIVHNLMNANQFDIIISGSSISLRFNSAMIFQNVTKSKSFDSYDIDNSLISGYITDDEDVIGDYMSNRHAFATDVNKRTTLIFTDPASQYVDGQITRTEHTGFTLYGVFIFNGFKKDSYSLELKEDVKNPITEYYEPLLTFEPYSFYSLSSLETNEIPLNKTRYYQSYNNGSYSINLDYVVSMASTLKQGLVVNYEINDYQTPYYTDSLIVTRTDCLPIRNDSYFSFIYQNMAVMKTQYAVTERNAYIDFTQGLAGQLLNIAKNGAMIGLTGGASAFINTKEGLSSATSGLGVVNSYIDMQQSLHTLRDMQQAQKAGAGAKPDTIKQTGSDVLFDSFVEELQYYLNHYTVDTVSYNNISKFLERYGYQVSRFDTINAFNRVGWNFIHLTGFDIEMPASVEQEESIRQILTSGVTILHDKSYMEDSSLHNYETSLE